ncbi:DUF1080 domain-containing protein [soil metagenome]
MKQKLKSTAAFLVAFASIALIPTSFAEDKEEGFQSLFDGKTMENWKVSENKENFKIEDGALVADGPRAHAFYTGDVNGGKFKDFELRLDVMTRKNANGGVFIHTDYQEDGWPGKGYEIQVNNTQSDWRKTGGIYAVVDNREPFEDEKWMEMVIRVEKGVITSTVDGKEIAKYEAEEGESRLMDDGGTIALQAHDPDSKVYYKNIRIKPLD